MVGPASVKITVDTNLLVRAAIQDDPEQTELAIAALRDAELVAVTLPTLCEFSWVMYSIYQRPRDEIAASIRTLTDDRRTRADRQAVSAGLAVLDEGGDFADGVIAYEGSRLGGETFVTFDRKAAALLVRAGKPVSLLKPARRPSQ